MARHPSFCTPISSAQFAAIVLAMALVGLLVATSSPSERRSGFRTGLGLGAAVLTLVFLMRVPGARTHARVSPIRSRLVPSVPVAAVVAGCIVSVALLTGSPWSRAAAGAGLVLAALAGARAAGNEVLGHVLGRCPFCLSRPLLWTLGAGAVSRVECPACGARWALGWFTGAFGTWDWLQVLEGGRSVGDDLRPVVTTLRRPREWQDWACARLTCELDALAEMTALADALGTTDGVPDANDTVAHAPAARGNAKRSMPAPWGACSWCAVGAAQVLFVGAVARGESLTAGLVGGLPLVLLAVIAPAVHVSQRSLVAIFARCPICLRRGIWWDIRLGRSKDHIGCAGCGAEWEAGWQLGLFGFLLRLVLVAPGVAMTEGMRRSLPTAPSPDLWRRWAEGRVASALDSAAANRDRGVEE
jgi:hypothetical protein